MKGGFSLLETIVSATLLGLIVIFVLNLFPSSMAAVRRSEQRLQAFTIASSVLEQEAALPPAQLVVGTSSDLPAQTLADIVYQTHLSITQYDSEPTTFLSCVLVTVSWQYAGQNFSLTRRLLVHRLQSDQTS